MANNLRKSRRYREILVKNNVSKESFIDRPWNSPLRHQKLPRSDRKCDTKTRTIKIAMVENAIWCYLALLFGIG